MEFRRAKEADLPQVLTLYAGAVQRMREAGIDQWDEIYPDEALLSDDLAKGQMYLLIDEEAPVSAVVLNDEQSPEYGEVEWQIREQPVAVIHRLCVSAREQGKGIGVKSLRLSEELLLEQGYRCIRLDAFQKNPIALKMYESNGYRRAGQVSFRKGTFFCYEKLLTEIDNT